MCFYPSFASVKIQPKDTGASNGVPQNTHTRAPAAGSAAPQFGQLKPFISLVGSSA